MKALLLNVKYGVATLTAISLVLIVGYQAVASGGDYSPIWGQGSHTVWDEEEGELGNTYQYYAFPTDYGWYTSVSTGATYSALSFVCYYTKESDSVSMAMRFTLNSGMPFSESPVVLSMMIDDHEIPQVVFIRRDENDAVVEAPVAGFDRSRAAESLVIEVGPFTFTHDIAGLFDVPAASNLTWCDDRDVEGE